VSYRRADFEERVHAGVLVAVLVGLLAVIVTGLWRGEIAAGPQPTAPTPTPTVTVTAPPATVKVTVPGPVRTVTVTRASRSSTNRAISPTQPRQTSSHAPVTGKAQRYARPLVSAAEWPCLRELWKRESGWSPTADNPTSSAYGIPQILGLEARTGDDYRAQVDAGLAYIKHRYGTACAALAHHDRKGWY